MVFLFLGTNDKDFSRLLKAIDYEIENGTIKDEVIVQSGKTKYKTDCMKVIDFLSMDEFNQYIDKADYIITHGGVGTILDSLKKDKKIIAVPRLKKYKEQGKKSEIQKALKELEAEYKQNKPNLPNEFCYLKGKYREKYLHDMKICQEYAHLNRLYIASIILNKIFGKCAYNIVNEKTSNIQKAKQSNVSITLPYFKTIHNYISFEDNIVRKGAISAKKGEKVLIPINMRDGSIIAVGKGNEDWNNSAPHGARRIMSRHKAKEILKLEEFKESMKDVYSTSVSEETIDEAPFAYKPMLEIMDNVKDTVEIEKIIKPIYNFKAKN